MNKGMIRPIEEIEEFNDTLSKEANDITPLRCSGFKSQALAPHVKLSALAAIAEVLVSLLYLNRFTSLCPHRMTVTRVLVGGAFGSYLLKLMLTFSNDPRYIPLCPFIYSMIPLLLYCRYPFQSTCEL